MSSKGLLHSRPLLVVICSHIANILTFQKRLVALRFSRTVC